MKVSSKERRKVVRAHADLPLDIYDPKGRMIVGEGRFVNLSTIGGMMESKKPLKPHAAIRLQLVPAGKTALELKGRVVWTRKKAPGFLYGIEFNDRIARVRG